MAKIEKRYNGYVNRDTWTVALWANNEERYYNEIQRKLSWHYTRRRPLGQYLTSIKSYLANMRTWISDRTNAKRVDYRSIIASLVIDYAEDQQEAEPDAVTYRAELIRQAKRLDAQIDARTARRLLDSGQLDQWEIDEEKQILARAERIIKETA